MARPDTSTEVRSLTGPRPLAERRPATPRLPLAAIGALCLSATWAAPAAAQSSRDAEFAEVLMKVGYLDLAEEEARRIEQSTSYDVKVRGDAGYLLVKILKAQSRQATGGKAQQLLDQVQKLIEELKTRYPNHQSSKVADLERLQAQLSEADTLLATAKDETDEAKSKGMNDRAVELYKEALGTFDAVIDEINAELDKSPNDDLEFKRDLAEYLRASAYLSYGVALAGLGSGDKDREEALGKALQQFRDFFENRGTFFNLWTLSYLGQGKAALELGKYDDAVETFQAMADIEPPGHPDPTIDRQQREFVTELLGEATYWQINAAVRANKAERAVEAFLRYQKQYPKHLDTHFGKLAVFEYGKALASLDRLRAAGDAIGVVLEQSMKGDVIAGFDIDRYGVAACKTLAEISAGTAGFLPAPLQYRAGQGFFFKREWERATYALKGVLAAGASDSERATWGPKALMDLGAAYQHLGRPFEAALAYQGLYRMFPDNPRAGEAMRFAKQNLELLTKQDPWFRDLVDEVIKDEQELLTGVGKERSKHEQARAYEKAGQYVRAAQKFLEIAESYEDPRTKQMKRVPFYGEALANAGYCYYLAADSGQGNVAQSRQQALETLQKALAYGRDNEQPDAWAAAAYYLSIIAGSDEEKRYDEALKALEAFEGPLKGQTTYLARVYAQQASCLVKLKRLAEAEERIERIVERFEDAPELPSAALELASSYVDAADAAVAAGQLGEAQKLEQGAARYVGLWAAKSKRMTFGGAAWAADILLRAGSNEPAVQAFERAFAVAKSRDALEAADREAQLYERTLVQYGRALAQLGRLDDAIKVFDQAAEGFRAAGQDPLKEFGYAFGLSHARYDRWQKTKDEGEVVKLREAHEAYWSIVRTAEDNWPSFVSNYRLPATPFFRVKLEADARMLEIRLAMKEWKQVKYEVDQLERQGWLDDEVDLADGSFLAGEITKANPDGGITIKVGGAERVLPAAEVKKVTYFPKEVRARFFELRERAQQGGGR